MISLEQIQQLTLKEMENQLTQLDFDWERCNDIIENSIIEKAKQGKCELELLDSCVPEQSEICVLLNVENIPRLYFEYLKLKFTTVGFKCKIHTQQHIFEYPKEDELTSKILYTSTGNYLKISWN